MKQYNIVDTWLDTLERDGLIQADALRLLNKACNKHYTSSSLNKYRKGRMEIPAVVQRYMLTVILKKGFHAPSGAFGVTDYGLMVDSHLTVIVQQLTPLPRDS